MSATQEQNACRYFVRHTLEVIEPRRPELNRPRTAACAPVLQ